MAYEKFIPERGGRGSMFLTPYVTINKGGMSFNRYVKEMIGDRKPNPLKPWLPECGKYSRVKGRPAKTETA